MFPSIDFIVVKTRSRSSTQSHPSLLITELTRLARNKTETNNVLLHIKEQNHALSVLLVLLSLASLAIKKQFQICPHGGDSEQHSWNSWKSSLSYATFSERWRHWACKPEAEADDLFWECQSTLFLKPCGVLDRNSWRNKQYLSVICVGVDVLLAVGWLLIL